MCKPAFQLVFGKEFIYRGRNCSIIVPFRIYQALHTAVGFLYKFGGGVNLFPCKSGAVFYTNTRDTALIFNGFPERRKLSFFYAGFQVFYFHPKAHIRFVASKTAHGFCMGKHWDFTKVHTSYFFKNMPGKTCKNIKHILLLYERHFAVDLGKLRLPVSPEILIPEAFYDLKIFIVPSNHKDLFKGLRAL